MAAAEKKSAVKKPEKKEYVQTLPDYLLEVARREESLRAQREDRKPNYDLEYLESTSFPGKHGAV